MKKTQKIYTNSKSYLILTIITSFIQAISSVYMALASKDLLDSNSGELLFNSIKLIITVLIMVIAYALNHLFQQKLQLKIENNLKIDLYNNIFKKEYYTISKIHSGKLMNYLTNDVNIVASSAATIVPSAILFATRLILALILLLVIEPYLALCLFAVGIVAFLGSYIFRKKLKKLHSNVQEKDGISRSFMQESIESMLVIKSFSGENESSNKMNEKINDLEKARNKRINFSVMVNSGLLFVFQFTYAFTLIWCVYRLNSGMTPGTLLALVQLVGQIQGPMTNLSGIVPKYYQMIASLDRINEILNLEEEYALKEECINEFTKIKISNLSFSYDDFKVIENANLIINKNDFILIKGESGIGKSTLLKLLLAIYKPLNGNILICDNEEEVSASKNTRGLFSYVPQGNFIFSGTIKENLTFFNPNVSGEQIESALDVSCAKEFINELENGLNTNIGEKGIGLSEGQIQRLAVARAILANRKIVLLDEATSALDQDTEIKLLNNLKKLNDVTCIIVTHKDASKAICNKEFVFDKTNIIEKTL